MSVTGTICKDCGTVDLHNETYKFYDDHDQLVAKLHRWIVQTPDGYQAKVVAKDQSWLEFETAELARPQPNLFDQFYGGHPGVLIINSEFVADLDLALGTLTQQFAQAQAWLSAKLGTAVEIV